MPFAPSNKTTFLPSLASPNKRKVKELKEAPQSQETTFFGATKRAFQLENSLGSWISDETKSNWKTDKDFDWNKAFDELPEPYQLNEDIANKFALAKNNNHFNAIKSQIDKEASNREYMANAGVLGAIANLSAGFLDLTNFIPVGGVAFRIFKAGKKGFNVINAGLRTAATAAGSVTAQELALHSTQQLRTKSESAFNVGAGALLGGVLGATGRAWVMRKNRKQFDAIAEELQKELTIPAEDLAEQKPKSLSSGAVNTKSEAELLEENSLKRGKLFKLISRIHPNLRLLYSPNLVARLAIQRLNEIVPTLKKNAQGAAISTSVEAKVKSDKAATGVVLKHLDSSYRLYRKRVGKERRSKTEFNQDVSKALIYGAEAAQDMGISKEAIEASKYVRRNIFDKFASLGLKIKGFWSNPKAIKENMSKYFHRLYDKSKVLNNHGKFIEAISEFIEEEYIKFLIETEPKTPKQKAKANFAERALQVKKSLEDLSPEARLEHEDMIAQEAHSIFEKVTGQESDVWQGGVPLGSGKGSPLKGRKLMIPDSELIDFLELDIEKVIKHYTNSLSPRLQLAKEFGNEFLTDSLSKPFGSLILKEYMDQYNSLLARAEKSPKKLLKLKKQKERDLSDIFAMRDRMLGRYGYSEHPNSWSYRVQKGLKQLTSMTLLGDVGASQIPDIGKIIMSGGIIKLFNKGIVPFIKNVKSTKLNTTHRQELARMLNGLTKETETRSMQLAGVMEDYGRHTKFERGLDYAADKAILISGMNHINMALRNAVGGVIQSEIYDAMKAVAKGTASTKTIEKLAATGISKENAIKMFKLIEKHGEIVDDIIFPASQHWGVKNRGLTEIFEASMQKALDAAVVTPGVGNTPLWMSHSGFTLFGQFKSFALSSMEKTLIPLVQNFDLDKAQGLVAMVSLGTMVAAYKHKMAGRKIPDSATLIQEGIDRSGVLAYITDWNNNIEDFTRGRGISYFTGANKDKKYYNSFNVLGASSQQVGNIYKLTSDIASGKVSRGTTHAARMLMPLQNMIGLRQVLDAWEEKFNQSMNIKK